jgi:hypothetical protein
VIWNLSEIEDGRSMNPASCFYLILLFPFSQQFQWPKKYCTHTHLFLLVYATTWRKSGGKERKWPLIDFLLLFFFLFLKNGRCSKTNPFRVGSASPLYS